MQCDYMIECMQQRLQYPKYHLDEAEHNKNKARKMPKS